MVGVKVEHVLMLVIVIFVIYYLIGSCDCTNGLVGVDGFNVGVQENIEDIFLDFHFFLIRYN